VVTPAARVRTFDLFSHVLNCASRGQLTPATIDTTLREFAIARGTEYTNSLARLAEDFVNGLVGVVNGRSERTGPTSERTGPTSERTGPAFETIGPPHELFARMTRLYFELLTRFTDLQTTQIEGCLQALLDAADAGPGALALSASLGDTAASSLIVENSGSEPLLVSCQTTTVRRADGVGPAFVPAIALTPLENTVGPGEELRVRTSLSLDPGVYEPDVLYIGALRLMRQQSLYLEVPLHITATRGAR
jgi:hypothetical protein